MELGATAAEDVGEPAAAVAAHAQTAEAEPWTASPVTAPQPETTHARAAELMAALDMLACDHILRRMVPHLLAGLHWHAKSVDPQPIPDAADAIHDTCSIMSLGNHWTYQHGNTYSASWYFGSDSGTLILSLSDSSEAHGHKYGE